MIYLSYMSDALDSLNNKKAIQNADKILKKQKDLHCAKVSVVYDLLMIL
jgi:N-terminal acetyltransferase B complex non-catalytic subunit